jgi:hypothetical protein
MARRTRAVRCLRRSAVSEQGLREETRFLFVTFLCASKEKSDSLPQGVKALDFFSHSKKANERHWIPAFAGMIARSEELDFQLSPE